MRGIGVFIHMDVSYRFRKQHQQNIGSACRSMHACKEKGVAFGRLRQFQLEEKSKNDEISNKIIQEKQALSFEYVSITETHCKQFMLVEEEKKHMSFYDRNACKPV